jgi:hypothetical protein
MAYKDESEYKTPLKKRERDRQWRIDHPDYHKEYRQDNKQNILYMAMMDDEYYFGQSAQGLDARRDEHIHNSRRDRSCGNPRMRELYKQLGEDEFMKRITFKVIKTFDTLADAQAAEKLMLSIYVGQPNCMNKHK